MNEAPPRSGAVYASLRDLIVRGQVSPGTRVSEAEVASRFGVSRTPAREALARLHQEGFLVTTGSPVRTQLAVSPLTIPDLTELYTLMGALEGVAARGIAGLEAARRAGIAGELETLTRRFEEGRTRVDPDLAGVFELHDAFHRMLVDEGAGTRTREAVEAIRPQVNRYEWVYAPLVGGSHEATFAEHGAIVRAVAGGAPDEIERAVRANWWNGSTRLAEAIRRAGTRGSW